MARKRKSFQNKEFYINRANAARLLSLKIDPDELYRCGWGREKREEFLERAGKQLKGTVFERDARSDGRHVVLKPAPAIGYLLGAVYLDVLRRIAAGDTQIVPSVSAIAIGIDESGKISQVTNPLYFQYSRFLHDLGFLDAQRIKECPECRAVFYGQRNSIYCSNRCTQKRWKEANPEAYQDAQAKRDELRKENRASVRLRKEQERWQ